MAKAGNSGKIDIDKTSRLLKAIADADRLRLILQVKNGEKNVGTLAKAIGVEIVNVSHHLGVLRSTHVLKDRKVGRFVFYSLNPDLITMDTFGALHLQMHGCKVVLGL
jgi:ArsR family transcriptional regulator